MWTEEVGAVIRQMRATSGVIETLCAENSSKCKKARQAQIACLASLNRGYTTYELQPTGTGGTLVNSAQLSGFRRGKNDKARSVP